MKKGNNKFKTISVALLLLIICNSFFLYSQDSELTEPVVIEPVIKGKPPSDAVVLFDGGSLENFVSRKTGEPAGWKVNGKKFTVVPGTGDIITKQKFGSCQVHLEWKTPVEDVKMKRSGQGSGNSGIYFMQWFEIQILNSYINKTGFKGQAAAVYGEYPPLVNASLPPGEWQTYDIVFIAPVFNTDGSVKSYGYLTVFHNGILVQYHSQVGEDIDFDEVGEDIDFDVEKVTGEVYKMPILLQDHGNKVSFRNFWVREL